MKFTISWLKEHLDTQKSDQELIRASKAKLSEGPCGPLEPALPSHWGPRPHGGPEIGFQGGRIYVQTCGEFKFKSC